MAQSRHVLRPQPARAAQLPRQPAPASPASTQQTLATLEKGIAPMADALRRARAHKVKIVFGTDAVAGSHGRNAEEFVYRVKEAGEKPMDALVSATSLSAESLGLGDRHRRDRRRLRRRSRGHRRQSARRHHRRPPRPLRDEGRKSLQELDLMRRLAVALCAGASSRSSRPPTSGLRPRSTSSS